MYICALANKVWGVYRNQLICPSVLFVRSPVLRLSVQNSCQVHIFFYKWKFEFLTSYKHCLWSEGVPFSLPKVILARSMTMAGKVQNLCPVPFFEWISICSYFAQRLFMTCLHFYYLWLKSVSWPCEQVIWGRSLAVKAQKSYPVLIF